MGLLQRSRPRSGQEREIDAAADHGIHGWMVDWDRHDGAMFYQEQLENGFLAARNRSRLRFALMWANHDWRAVYPARSPEEAYSAPANPFRSQTASGWSITAWSIISTSPTTGG